MKLDAKFYGEIKKAKDDSVVPEDEWCVFLAKDNCLPSLLALYKQLLRDRKADQRQIDAVQRMLDRVIAWRKEHPERCKVPDVDETEWLLDLERPL